MLLSLVILFLPKRVFATDASKPCVFGQITRTLFRYPCDRSCKLQYWISNLQIIVFIQVLGPYSQAIRYSPCSARKTL